MSQDVILGSTDRSWSRGSVASVESDSQPAPLTDKEKVRIERLAQLEMRATNGDVTAQKKMVEINAVLADLQRKAKKGDAKAARIIYTLRDSGLVQQVASTSRKGSPRLAMAGDELGFNGHLAFIRGLGEEEIALAMEGGQCERDALVRRSDSGHSRLAKTPHRTRR